MDVGAEYRVLKDALYREIMSALQVPLARYPVRAVETRGFDPRLRAACAERCACLRERRMFLGFA
jgi:hypothetical protein